MLWYGHLAFCYVVLVVISHFSGIVLTPALLWAAFIGSLIPDIDLIIMWGTSRAGSRKSAHESHRSQLSHIPLFWITLLLIAALLFGSWLSYVAAFGIGILTHLLGDSIEYGVAWLWPWKGKLYAMRKTVPHPIDRKNLWRYYWTMFHSIYVRSVTFWVELIIVMMALLRIYFVGS